MRQPSPPTTISAFARLIRLLIPDIDRELRINADLKLCASVNKHLGLFRGTTLRREVETAVTLASYVPPCGVVYDIGANIGLYTILFAANRSRRVVSFEPADIALRYLRRNVQINKLDKVDVRQIALSNRAGTCHFHIDELTTATSRVCDANQAGIDIECSDLDSYALSHALPPPDLIKIDVEGHDWPVVRGMNETIRRHRPHVYLEGGVADQSGRIPAISELSQWGYEFFDLRKSRRLNLDSNEYAFLAVPRPS